MNDGDNHGVHGHEVPTAARDGEARDGDAATTAKATGPSSNWLWIGMMVSIALLGGIMALGLIHRRKAPELPVLASIPRFELTNERSQPVTSATYKGKVWIADFIFLGCQASCPKLTARMAN